MFDVMLLQNSPDCFFVKISEGTIRHDFNITDGQVEYIVLNDRMPVTRSPAEILDVKTSEYGHIEGLTIRTPLYDYEVVQNEVYTFYAYKSKRK